MRRLLTISLVILYSWTAMAQRGDSLLRNERTMDRPIIVHDKQLRITAGYNFATLAARFDENGDRIKLSDQGVVSVQHHALIDIKYGFKELVQLNLLLNYKSRNERQQPVNVFTLDNSVEISEISQFTGMEDIFIGADVLLPWTSRELDIALSAGVTLPTATNEPDIPSHYAQSFVDASNPASTLTEVEYWFNENLGTGTTMLQLGTQVKYRFSDLAISAQFQYRFPSAESDSRTWTQRTIGTNEFEYRSRPFQLSPANQYFGRLEVEYQLYPWINLFMDIDHQGTSGGWTEESGQRVALQDQRLTIVSPGIEMLLTPRFWLRQRIVLGLVGENSFSPIGIDTGLIYNLFPLEK